MKKLKPTICILCDFPLVVRSGPSGPFLGCSRFPACLGTADTRLEDEFEGPDYDPDFDLYPDPYDLGYDGDG